MVTRKLVRFNCAYLAGVASPDQPWLSRGWLRSWVEAGGAALAELVRGSKPQLTQMRLDDACCAD